MAFISKGSVPRSSGPSSTATSEHFKRKDKDDDHYHYCYIDNILYRVSDSFYIILLYIIILALVYFPGYNRARSVGVAKLHRILRGIPISELPVQLVGALDEPIVLHLDGFAKVARGGNHFAHGFPWRQPLEADEDLAHVVAGPTQLPIVLPLVSQRDLQGLDHLLFRDVPLSLEAKGLIF